MQINTKYNLGDELWTIDHDEVVKFKVGIIHTVSDAYLKERTILYAGEGANVHSEDKCFKTKEELINSLK